MNTASIKHKVVAGLFIFAGVAISLYILKKGQQRGTPVLATIANAVVPSPAIANIVPAA